jgi:hypothetical protein
VLQLLWLLLLMMMMLLPLLPLLLPAAGRRANADLLAACSARSCWRALPFGFLLSSAAPATAGASGWTCGMSVGVLLSSLQAHNIQTAIENCFSPIAPV